MSSIFPDGPYFLNLKPREWPFKLQKWAFMGLYDLEPKLQGICTSENQGKALRQDFALCIECKNRMLIRHKNSGSCHMGGREIT